MTKLNRILLILLAAQAVLFAAIRLLEPDHHLVKPIKLLGDLKTEDVTAIAITDGDGKSVSLKKAGDGWVLSSGGDYPAEKSKVDEFLGKLPALEASADPVASKASLHRAFEVADKKFQRKVVLTTTDKKTRTFFLGSSPGIKKVHFRFAESEDVFAAGELSTWDIGTSPSSWVKTEYLKAEKDKVVALTLINAQGTFEFKKGDGDKLSLADLKKGETLKQSEVDSLLSSATSLNLREPVSKTTEARFGLDKPLATVTFTTETEVGTDKDKASEKKAGESPTSETSANKDVANKDGKGNPTASARGKGGEEGAQPQVEHKTFRLIIGAKDGETYFVKSDGSPFIVKVDNWAAKTFVEKKRADFLEEKKKEGEDNAPKPPAH